MEMRREVSGHDSHYEIEDTGRIYGILRAILVMFLSINLSGFLCYVIKKIMVTFSCLP